MKSSNEKRAELGRLFRLTYSCAYRSLKAGYYLEALSLCDSLITSRLQAILSKDIEGNHSDKTIVRAANELLKMEIPEFDVGLWQECRAWGKQRNFLMHEMVKIDDGSLSGWRSRLKLAKSTAEAGLVSANRLSRESRKH